MSISLANMSEPVAWRWRDNEYQSWNFIDFDPVHMDYVHVEPLYARPDETLICRWLPIEQADKAIVHQQHFASINLTIRNSERYWVRDNDGRVYEASWTEGDNGRNYWWDWDGESPVDPVEFMPHPLAQQVKP